MVSTNVSRCLTLLDLAETANPELSMVSAGHEISGKDYTEEPNPSKEPPCCCCCCYCCCLSVYSTQLIYPILHI